MRVLSVMRRKLNDLMNGDFAVLVALHTGHHAISAMDKEAESETFVPALASLTQNKHSQSEYSSSELSPQ